MIPGAIIKSSLFCLFLAPVVSCNTHFHPTRIEDASIQIEHSERLQPDTSMKMLIEPYRESMSHSIKQVIGFAPHDLDKRRPESTLGNWVADAMLDYAIEFTGEDLDLAITNYGGLRIQSIPAGPVTLEKLYELMPFDNLMVITDLSGSELIELLDHVAGNGGWPISRGIRLTISDGKATNIRLNNKSIEKDKVYKVVINDYIANGGSDSHFLKERPRRTLNVLVRDALIARASKGIQAELEERIKFAKGDG